MLTQIDQGVYLLLIDIEQLPIALLLLVLMKVFTATQMLFLHLAEVPDELLEI